MCVLSARLAFFVSRMPSRLRFCFFFFLLFNLYAFVAKLLGLAALLCIVGREYIKWGYLFARRAQVYVGDKARSFVKLKALVKLL